MNPKISMKMKHLLSIVFLSLITLLPMKAQQGWVSDNGNGTYTNPLFFEEFSDPCMIRVGHDFYLTGTTMHCMPGLPILHSRDLVNWRLISYVFDRFNLGPEFSFEGGRDMYGQGIWAPSFAYKDSTFYIFANVNGHSTQCYKSRSPYGPWQHWSMKSGFHDLTVFFDEDGKSYVCWGAGDNFLAQLNPQLDDTIPGTTRLIAHSRAEGGHLYKINGKYIIVWAVPGGSTDQLAGKSDNIYGPYEIVPISHLNHMGVGAGYGQKSSPLNGAPAFTYYNPDPRRGLTLHQGGLIDTPTGEWWGYSMQDHNSLGRVTNLTPVTWKDGFPYFGLEGNLTKTPKTWVKPNVGLPAQPPVTLATRDDDFSAPTLQLIWQWNHLPNDKAWSLTEQPGMLRLHALPAPGFWHARNTLTQRAAGIEATCGVDLDLSGLHSGDVAGLALLNSPYALLQARRTEGAYEISMIDESNPAAGSSVVTSSPFVHMSVHTNFLNEKAQFYYSTAADTVTRALGGLFTMVYQLKTFQGIRYSLFCYNTQDKEGGYADFDNFSVAQNYPRGLRRAIPYGKTLILLPVGTDTPVALMGVGEFMVKDKKLGRVALSTSQGALTVDKEGKVTLSRREAGDVQSFQWTELEDGSLVLLSLATHRYLQWSAGGTLTATQDVPSPDGRDGCRFVWSEKLK